MLIDFKRQRKEMLKTTLDFDKFDKSFDKTIKDFWVIIYMIFDFV